MVIATMIMIVSGEGSTVMYFQGDLYKTEIRGNETGISSILNPPVMMMRMGKSANYNDTDNLGSAQTQ